MRVLILITVLSLLGGVAACLNVNEPAEKNPFGGETRIIVHQEGSRERELGLLKTISYYDQKGRKRRQIDYYAENHPWRIGKGVYRVEANYNEAGTRVVEILTFDEKGAFIESIIPVSQ